MSPARNGGTSTDHDAIDMPAFVPPLEEHWTRISKRVMAGIEARQVSPSVRKKSAMPRHVPIYANVTSYFDGMIGEHRPKHWKRHPCQLDDTIVIATADHGDMLGERGLWYKMNFFEHSARVPLVMAGPGVVHGTAPNACSLIDVLPTLIEIAGGDDTLWANRWTGAA